MYEKINPSFKFLSSTKAFRIVAIYLVLSLLWIFFTDNLVFNFISDTDTQNLVSSIKGWFFVIATTLLLYHLIQQALKEVTTAEQKLIESEIRFRSVFENSVDAIGVLNAGIHFFVNPAYLTLFGYSHIDELVGKPVIDLIAPDKREYILDIVKRRAKGEVVPSTYETVGFRKDGSEFDMDVNVSSYDLNFDNYTLVILRDITERKKADDAIRENEQRYQTLANISPAGIFRTDANGSTTYVNPKWGEISGLSAQEAMRNGWLNAVHYEDREKLSANWKDATSKHNVSLAEYRFVHSDGTIVWVMGQAVPEKNFENQIVGYVGTITDITERKKAEEEILRISEKRKELEFIVNKSQTVAFLWKAEVNWPVEYVSENISQFGYTPEELLSGALTFAKMVYPEDLERVTQEVSHYSHSGVNEFVQEYRIVTKSGDVRWVNDQTFVRRDQNNKITHYQGTVLDITDYKKAEEAIRESEEKFRVLTESTSAAIFIFKGEQFRYLNSYAELLTGYTKEELINKKFWEIVHPDYRNLIKERGLARLRGETVASRYEFKIVTKAGEERWLDFTAGLIQFEGEPSGIGTAIDITERKRAFEELQKSRQEYRALSAHLQRIREEERASIAREMHDELGQILTSLKMNIAFTRRELEESESIEIKNKMLSEFQAMNLTIDKAVSEVRKLITQLRPELLDKLGLIAALEWYSEEYQKTTKINCVFTSESEELFLDHDKELAVFRIVQEAMTNAAKHSDAKSVQIMLGKRENKLSIEIIDDGKGILETGLDGTTSFGLLGMRERASIIGGNLEIFGAPGKGTTVRLVIGDYKQRNLRGYNTTNDV